MDAPLYAASQFIELYGLPFRLMFYRQQTTRRHYHDFDELVFVLEGSATHESEGRQYPVFAGDVFLIPCGATHAYLAPSHLRLANLMIRRETLQPDMGDWQEIPGFKALFETEPSVRNNNHFQAKLSLSSTACEEIRLRLERLERECSERRPGYRIAATGLFRELLVTVARSYGGDAKKSSRKMVQLSRMIQFMEAHYQEPVTRNEIVAASGISCRTASRIFQELCGEGMIEWLLAYRIRAAERMLRESDDSVAEIAERCGFRDSNYFSSQFRKKTGKSAVEYRTFTAKKTGN